MKHVWEMTQDEFLIVAYPLSVRRQMPPCFASHDAYLQFRQFAPLGATPTEADVEKAQRGIEAFVAARRAWWAGDTSRHTICALERDSADIAYAARISGLYAETIAAHLRTHYTLCRAAVAEGKRLPPCVAAQYPNLAAAQEGKAPLPERIKFAPKRLPLYVVPPRYCRRYAQEYYGEARQGGCP